MRRVGLGNNNRLARIAADANGWIERNFTEEGDFIFLRHLMRAAVRELLRGEGVLVAAHGNSLRALAMHLEGLSRDEVIELNIPTGQPRVYELDDRMQITGWRYLDPEGAAAAADAVARQAG